MISKKQHIPRRVLIINIFGIGDVLFTTPLISNLKEFFPDLHIGYVCNKRTALVLKNHSKVDSVYVYERDEFNQIYHKSKILFVRKIIEFLKAIKKDNYDTAIDVSLSGFMSFYAWWIGIKNRIGLNYKNRSRFLTTKVPIDGFEGKHVVEYHLSLLKEFGCIAQPYPMELPIRQADTQWVDRFFKENRLDSREKVIAIVPGGGASWGKDARYRRWPTEKYAKLADKLIEKFSTQIIILGDITEEKLCQQVTQRMRHACRLVCGQTTICQFGAFLRKCTLVVMNDGGPLHISVAAGAKTVSIFGPVDENVYGPYPYANHLIVKKDLPCRPCYQKFRRASCDHISCLNQISVEDVLRKVEELL